MARPTKPPDVKLQISCNVEPPRSTRYTDEMFPLDDLEIIQDYSLDAMAFGERTITDRDESFEKIEHSMCGPPSQTKEDPQPPVDIDTKDEEEKENNENIPPEEGQGGIIALITAGYSLCSKFF